MKNKIGIIITTLGRDELLEKAVLSILKYRPENSIILIGDQGLKDIDILKKERYENKGCYFYTLPYNIGLSYVRNYLVERANDMGCQYIVLISDSMCLTENTEYIDSLIPYLEDGHRDLIGCKLNGGVPIFWVGKLNLLPGRCFELDFIDRSKVEVGKSNLFDCEIVHNFFIATTKSLLDVKWDENLPLCEHEDFFYRYKLQGFKVGWTPDVSCDYVRNHGAISNLRQLNWNDGLRKLLAKWKISSWITYKNRDNGLYGVKK